MSDDITPGLARMAHARRVAGQPLTDHDRRALAAYPDDEPYMLPIDGATQRTSELS